MSDDAHDPGPLPDMELGLLGAPGVDEPDLWESGQAPRTLVELVNRVLDRGVVVGGDAMISVAGVDLVYLGLNALLTSVSTARRTLGPGRATGVSGVAATPAAPGGVASQGFALRGGVAAGERVNDRDPDRSPVIPADTPPTAAQPPVGDTPAASAAATPATPASPSSPPSPAESLAAELSDVVRALPERLDIDADSVQRDLGRLVLVIVELLRRVVEHQALRRMDDDDLSEAQVERMGVALQRLEEKMVELKGVFGLADDDLDVDLGPLGKLY